MKKFLIVVLFSILISCARAQEVIDSDIVTTEKATNESSSSTPVNEIATTQNTILSESSTSLSTKEEAISVVTETLSASTTQKAPDSNNSHEELGAGNNDNDEDDDNFDHKPSSSVTHASSGQKRKVLYINQQQSGKLNVHLELNDVSLIVIPNRKVNDPQLSLLNLLLKSAQKSNMKNEEHKKKEHEENVKRNEHHNDSSNSQSNDEYSKYKMENNYLHTSTHEPIIESRAPYRVDISSTLGQNPSQMPSYYKMIKPIPVIIQQQQQQHPQLHTRMYKRSLDAHFLNVLDDKSISNTDNNNDEEELINSLENNETFNGGSINVENPAFDSEFILLGAVENCGPGRKRNSYQICVSVDD
jgi:hypothetical protein